MHSRNGFRTVLSLVCAGVAIAAVSGAAGWIGGVLVTRAQVIAIVERQSAATGAAGSSFDASRRDDYFSPNTCLARYK